jgi:hypothetical protein
MRPRPGPASPAEAILAMAEIKASADSFDRGDANVFDALHAIIMAVEAYLETARPEPRRGAA